MVKYFIALLACCAVFTACNDSKEEENKRPTPGQNLSSTYLHSYIPYYMDGKWAGSGRIVNDHSFCAMNLREELEEYVSPDVAKPDVEAENTAEFQRLATRNGDLSYNSKDLWISYMNRVSYVHNLRAIHAVCTSGDWDADHAQGESLDDCISVLFCSYGRHVDSGYKLREEEMWMEKRLCDLEEIDLKMINPDYTGIQFIFDPVPANGNYTVRVTLVTTENEEIVTDIPVVVQIN